MDLRPWVGTGDFSTVGWRNVDGLHARPRAARAGPVSHHRVDLAQVTGNGGVVWSVSPEGFHTNLVVLEPAGTIPAHRNDSLDVLIVALTGAGVATIDGDAVDLAPLSAVLVPRGAVRAITAGAAGLRYLTIHAQRGPMTIGRKDPGDV